MVDFEQDIRNCLTVLRSGGTILYPTDTIWGLGCNALDPLAVNKIFTIKCRPTEKSLIILLAEARDLFKYVATLPPDIIALIEGFEQPTTVIYDHPLGLPPELLASDGSLGIRVTNDLFCKALIKRSGNPLVSTSANRSGKPSPTLFSNIDPEVKKKVDYVVRYRQNETTPAVPSRLIRLRGDGRQEIIRT